MTSFYDYLFEILLRQYKLKTNHVCCHTVSEIRYVEHRGFFVSNDRIDNGKKTTIAENILDKEENEIYDVETLCNTLGISLDKIRSKFNIVDCRKIFKEGTEEIDVVKLSEELMLLEDKSLPLMIDFDSFKYMTPLDSRIKNLFKKVKVRPMKDGVTNELITSGFRLYYKLVYPKLTQEYMNDPLAKVVLCDYDKGSEFKNNINGVTNKEIWEYLVKEIPHKIASEMRSGGLMNKLNYVYE